MKSSGLTIIEVLIALAVIGVLFAALAVTQVGTFRVTSQSQRASVATQAASKEVDGLSRTVLADFATYNNCTASSGAPCSGGFSRSGASGTYTVLPLGTTSYLTNGVIKITVHVTKPTNLTLDTNVSCIDQDSAPTVASPSSCFG